MARRPPPLIPNISDYLLEVRELTMDLTKTSGAVVRAVEAVSFSIPRDRTLALVGESGSGKSLIALAIMGLLDPQSAQISPITKMRFDGHPLRDLSPSQWQKIRGTRMAMIFKDPSTSMSPLHSVGAQLSEMLLVQRKLPKAKALARVMDMLHEVGIEAPERIVKAYPHELSRSQLHRVVIAMALACEPELLIAHAPAAGLDITHQRDILQLLAHLQRRRRMSLLLLAEDLGSVSQMADEAVILRKGRMREAGPVRALMMNPKDAYTQALLCCRASMAQQGLRLRSIAQWMQNAAPIALQAAPAPTSAQPLLQVIGLSKVFAPLGSALQNDELMAIDNVNFQLHCGHTLGLLGESGAGIPTVVHCLLRLQEATSGQVLLEGEDLLALTPSEFWPFKKRLQWVFDNPLTAVNQRQTVLHILSEPMQLHGIGKGGADWKNFALSLLDQVGMPAAALERYPFELTAEQGQRIAIARSLSLSPQVLVLDQPTRWLDISAQAQVLNLLKDLQQNLGLSYVFISRDLEVMRYMSETLLVMHQGQVIEQGRTSDVFAQPQHAYTQSLLAGVPRTIPAELVWTPAQV